MLVWRGSCKCHDTLYIQRKKRKKLYVSRKYTLYKELSEQIDLSNASTCFHFFFLQFFVNYLHQFFFRLKKSHILNIQDLHVCVLEPTLQSNDVSTSVTSFENDSSFIAECR